MSARGLVSTDDGVTLWSETSGSGPPLLLCHGGPGAFDALEPVAEMISDVVTVHRWDQRGSGRSHRTGPYTVERFVADMEAIREHFGHGIVRSSIGKTGARPIGS